MSPGPTTPTDAAGSGGERLAGTFVGIVLVQVAVVLALYWMGVHFAS